MADTIALTRQQNNTPARYRPNGDGSFDEVYTLGASPSPAATQMGTILSGTTGASAAAIGTTQACLSVLLINTHATLSLKWGNGTAQPATLEAGGQQIIPASNVTQVYVINGSGAATWSAIPEVVV